MTLHSTVSEALAEPSAQAVLISLVASDDLATWLAAQPPEVRGWIGRCGFTAAGHEVLRVPGPPDQVVYGLGWGLGRWALGAAPAALGPGDYRLDPDLPAAMAREAVIAWIAGGYRFARYRTCSPAERPRLCWPPNLDRVEVLREAAAGVLVRDLVNCPANDLGPAELEAAVRQVARPFGATVESVGGAYLARDYPLVDAVGRGSVRAPRLIDLRWGDRAAPRLTLVGKGVCFDTGGLDIKSADSMRLMKKDMAGAAHALALAQMVMDAGLPVRLRLLIPAVENAVGGRAMRPLDIVRSRKGLTVEIGHTDAEGRLILADALAAASEEAPDLLIDFATLTGAARVALGTGLPAIFSNDDRLARDLEDAATETEDPLWRLPLWEPYAKDLQGGLADLVSILPTPHAGAVYAALFLRNFVAPATSWAHLDIFGWALKARPGQGEGAEVQGLRAAFRLAERRFGGSNL